MSDEWSDDLDDAGPDEADDETAELAPCPACGEEIYEDAEQCPYCGEYVTHSTSALSGRPLWFCALGLIGVAVAIFCLIR